MTTLAKMQFLNKVLDDANLRLQVNIIIYQVSLLDFNQSFYQGNLLINLANSTMTESLLLEE